MSSLSDSVKVIKAQMADFQTTLAEKIASFQSLEKDLSRKLDFVHKQKEQMIADVNKTVQEQINHIKQEGELLIAEICKHAADFEGEAIALSSELMNSTRIANEQLNSLKNIAKISLDGLLLERFSTIQYEIKSMMSRNHQPLWIPSRHLIPTGSYRNLGLKFEELNASSVEYINGARTGDHHYYSVRWITEHLLVAGSDHGIEIRDKQLNLIRSLELDQCFDVVPYGDQFLVLQSLSDNTRTIALYSQILSKIRHVVEFPVKSRKLSQMATTDERIVASDPENKRVYIWSFAGDLLHTIELSDMTFPLGVCISAEGAFLVSDWSLKGSLRKYQMRGDYAQIWKLDGLQRPHGIVEHITGHLYVSRNEANNHSVYQLTSDGKLLKEMTCDQLKNSPENSPGLSISRDYLAVACRKDGLKLFQFKYSL